MKSPSHLLVTFLTCATLTAVATAQDTVENYIKEYPNQEQVKVMNAWLAKNEKGTFQFTGLVGPTDDTVVTPQGNRGLRIQLV